MQYNNAVLPPPPPPRPLDRYVDSDTYFLRNAKRLSQLHHAQDDWSLPSHHKRLSYLKWLQNRQNQRQEDIVQRFMRKLYKSPTNWQIDFDILSEYGRERIFEPLKDFFQNVLSLHAASNEYKISFAVGTEWHSLPFTPQIFNKLMENLTEQNFLFHMDERPAEYFYKRELNELPDWSLFSSLKFSRIYNEKEYYQTIGGEFFLYLVDSDVPKPIKKYLERLQIFSSLDKNGKVRKQFDDCCFVYALTQTGLYDESTLNQIRLRINNRFLSQNNLNQLCVEFGIHIDLSFIDEQATGKNKKRQVRSQKNGVRKNYLGIADAPPNRTHHFNVYQKHYFIEEKTPITSYYAKNWRNINDASKFNKEYRVSKGKGHFTKGITFISSSNLVRTLFEQRCFHPITYGEYKILNTVFYNEIDDENLDLDYNPDYCTKLIQPKNFTPNDLKKKPGKKYDPTIWYADFEADTSGKIHVPYLCVLHSHNGVFQKVFKGRTCNISLLDFLPPESIVYFHNLSYDIRFLASLGISNSTPRGNSILKSTIQYKGKKITLKDTVPILSCKLKDIPKMFKLDDVMKEIFPYKYYTLDRLEKGIGKISEAGLKEDQTWTDHDKYLFNLNIDSIPGCRKSTDEFDMWKYAIFYCNQDVNILRLGFNKFCEGFKKDFNINPFNFVSISSLANEVFNQKVFYNHNLFEVGGVVRKFLSGAIYGGRCMTAWNKKWHIKNELYDFDAKSLYPSAMARLYTVEGIPRILKSDEKNMEFLSNCSAYVVEIIISKVHKHDPFPLIVQKTKNGNLNDDHISQPLRMTVDNITLEDLINFQKIDFDIVKGYYWKGQKDFSIQKEIRKIFDKRLEYQKEKNPLEQIYKLIMNSCYGKTIERPHEKDLKYFQDDQTLERFWMKNYNKIVEDIELSHSPFSKAIHQIKTLKPIDKHFNFSLMGIQVLSMSKRIMNEVMCLAYDCGCRIYYQDTDSFMIEKEDLPCLENQFEKKYHRKLIGSQLGQFHCDFKPISGHDEDPWAIESYFLMKKMYVMKITDSTGEIDYVIRGKGLTLNSILALAEEKFGGDVMKVYEAIYNGSQETFDLTKGQPRFSLNKNMTVSTLDVFKRRISTTYDKADALEYFDFE